MKGKYLVIGLIIALVFSLGCVENVSPKSKMDEKSDKEPVAPVRTIGKSTSTPIYPTPTPTSTNKVLIQHNVKRFDKLTKYILSDGPEYEYPDPGMTFLVVNLKITNLGYPMVKINQYQWNLKVNTRDNPNSYVEADKIFSGKEDGIECKETELENGGWALCKIPFVVPENYDQYKTYWNNNINTEWKFVPEQELK